MNCYISCTIQFEKVKCIGPKPKLELKDRCGEIKEFVVCNFWDVNDKPKDISGMHDRTVKIISAKIDLKIYWNVKTPKFQALAL